VVTTREFAHPAPDGIDMESKRQADRALPAMTKRPGFQGGVMPPLTLIERLKKLLFDLEIFYGHRTT